MRDEYGLATQTRVLDTELIKIFPESIEIIRSLISELQQKQAAASKVVTDRLAAIDEAYADQVSRNFWKQWLDLNEGAELADLNRRIARLKRQLRTMQGIPAPKGMLTDDTIQAARDVPIESVLDQQFRRGGKTLIGLCPFHEDRRPSFHIYPQDNRCWCFGCNSGGDVIDVVMRLNDCTFQKAIAILGGEV